MKIIINNSSMVPIYEQIMEQIKAQIIGGDLQEDESLPSIRSLAKDLRISVITTKRAYEELEKEGFAKESIDTYLGLFKEITSDRYYPVFLGYINDYPFTKTDMCAVSHLSLLLL